jgi:hypothetical protein
MTTETWELSRDETVIPALSIILCPRNDDTLIDAYERRGGCAAIRLDSLNRALQVVASITAELPADEDGDNPHQQVFQGAGVDVTSDGVILYLPGVTFVDGWPDNDDLDA